MLLKSQWHIPHESLIADVAVPGNLIFLRKHEAPTFQREDTESHRPKGNEQRYRVKQMLMPNLIQQMLSNLIYQLHDYIQNSTGWLNHLPTVNQNRCYLLLHFHTMHLWLCRYLPNHHLRLNLCGAIIPDDKIAVKAAMPATQKIYPAHSDLTTESEEQTLQFDQQNI